MTLADHQAALAPKMNGSWNLHQYFAERNHPLDFYIMLSSLVGVVGFASQCNYAAGGTFQDALARHRVEHGMPGVSIDLGIVNSVGYLAEASNEATNKTIETLKRHGFTELSEEDVFKAIGSAIATPFAGQLTLGINAGPQGESEVLGRDMRFSGLRYRETGQSSANDKSTESPKPGAGAAATDLASQLSASKSREEAVGFVVAGVAKKLQEIFMMAEDDMDPAKSPAEFGVDSLVAVELRNMLALKAGADLSIFDIMQSGSLTDLAGAVVGRSRFVTK